MLARLGLVVVAPLLVAGTFVPPQLVTTTQSEPVKKSDPQTAASMDLLAVPRGDSRRDPTEGDEATEIELPRLGPPKS